MMRFGMKLAAIAGSIVFAMTGVAPADPVAIKTIDFSRPDRDATRVARAMYGEEFEYVVGKRFWLVKPEEGKNDQIAMQLGHADRCRGECFVSVLYHTPNGWAEIFRRQGHRLGIGELNTETGLKSLIVRKRQWDWDGKNYYPLPAGSVPKYRKPTEAEMKLALKWLNGQSFFASTAPPQIDVIDMDLRNGDEKALMLEGTICGNGECPVLLVDGDTVKMAVTSLGPDVRQGRGGERLTDRNGFITVEVLHPHTVQIVSVSLGKTLFSIERQPVTRAGTKRLDPYKKKRPAE